MSETAASYSSPTARAADDRFSPASDSGNGGGNSPPITITDNVPNYPEQGLFSKLINTFSPYVAGYAGTVIGGPFSGKKFFDVAKEETEKNQNAEDLVRNAMLSGSQVFSIPGSFQQAYNKQYGIPNIKVTEPTFTGGDNQPIKLPIIAQTPTDVESTPSDFDLYAALEGREAMRFGQNSFSSTGAMQRFAEGGRARQAYGLGGLIRKVGKAVKKVLKSDVGKAALLYGAGTYLGGTKFMGGDGTLSFMDRLKNPALLKNFFYTDDKFSPLKAIATGTALTGFLAKNEEEDDDLDGISDRKDESGLRELMAGYPALRFQVPRQYQLAANGGRIGYEGGGNINPADLPMSREGFPTYEDT